MGERVELEDSSHDPSELNKGFYWIRSSSFSVQRVTKRRVGIVGFGNLGQYLVQAVRRNRNLELAFVWNRNSEALKDKVPSNVILKDLNEFYAREADLIVEVAHPSITQKYGRAFLQQADYLIGSPTAMAEPAVEAGLRQAASVRHGLYIPSGAFWGGEDIKKMADRGTLKGLKVTMKKHPSCFKLEGDLQARCDAVQDEAVVLYQGPVRTLCPLAPNNVNTMAAAAIAAHNLGFDVVQGCLVADPCLRDWHIVEVEVTGPEQDGNTFAVNTIRKNPANLGSVTGSATYASFFSSLLAAQDKGPGVHLC